MRLRRMAAGIVLGGLLAVGGVTAASAAPMTSPVDVSGGLVDRSNVLSSTQESTIRSELDAYGSKTGESVYIAFVPTFTDPADETDWALATARASGISSSRGAVVLAVATSSRRFGYATSPAFSLSDSAVEDVIASDLTPQLKNSAWAAGASAFISGLQRAQGGGGSGSSGSTGSTADSDDSGGGILITLLLLAALIVVIVVLVRVVRKRRRAVPAGAAGGAAAPVGPPPVDQKQLDQQASRALISLDDDLTTSEQELGFASAEFGDSATADFASALQTAKATSRQAFEIRQRLDDDIPETPEQRRAMTEQIIQLCTKAERTLTAQAKPFDELRKLEEQLPVAIPAATADRDRLSKRADDATTALDALRTQFGDPAVQGAADDLRQARDLIALAATALAHAEDARSAGKGGDGAVALRSAQQALGQAGTLLDGIVAAPGEFMSAKRRLDAAIDDTRADIAEAEKLQARPAGGDRKALTAAVRDARTAVEAAALQAPTVGLAAVEAADGKLDTALATLRDEAERLKRAKATLPRTLDAAQQSIDSCKRFIDSRRGGIGSEARTRISEAQRELDRAVSLQEDDPVAALQSAQHAQSLASTAYDLAQQDVDDFRGGGGGGWGGGYGGGGGNVLGGAVLAGVLGGILSGGGGNGGGGGWAGGGFGGGGGGGGWGGGGGGFGGGGGGGGGGF